MKCSGCLIGYLQFFHLSEASLWEWLVDHGVVPGEMMCKKCKQPMKFVLSEKGFRCTRRRRVRKGSRMVNLPCNFQRSARRGSWLGNSLSSVKDIANFCSLWLCSTYPKNAKLARITGFATPTIAAWSLSCRETCISWACSPSQRLGGPGTVVEIAEAKFRVKGYSFGRKRDNYSVIGGIQRGSSKIFLVEVLNRKHLLRVLAENVLPGTTIIVDGPLDEEDSVQDDVKHGLQFVKSNNRNNHTRNAQRLLSRLRRFLPKGRKRETFQGYLAEYVFRKAYRHKKRLHHFFVEASKIGSSRLTLVT